MFTWTCWLDGDFPLAQYSAGCSMKNVSTPESYTMNLGTFASRAATLDWQVSFVPTSRTRGTVRSSNLFPSGQCTYGAERQFYLHFSVYPEIRGDARLWYVDAKSHGWTVTNEPESNSVVVWQPGVDGALSTGHVGWVEGIEYRAGVPYLHTSELNIVSGQGNTYRHRILKASTLAAGNPPQRGYILGTR
jgi:surface antigen